MDCFAQTVGLQRVGARHDHEGVLPPPAVNELAGGIAKCLSKGAKNVSKGKADGLNTCLNDTKKGVIPKFNAKVAGITPGADCSLGTSAGTSVLNIIKGLNSTYYCQSPSGAFVDGVLF